MPKLEYKIQIASVLLVQIVALTIFSWGFFQWGPRVPISVPSVRLKGWVEQLEATRPKDLRPTFDRLVFMVIDALRADFVFGDRFPDGFSWLRTHLVESGGRQVIALARAPTVTLPRLKALTAGTAPRFLDIAFNLGGDPVNFKLHNQGAPNGPNYNNSMNDSNVRLDLKSEIESSSPDYLNRNGDNLVGDSWVELAALHNRSVLHYGDETWLRLFPKILHPDSEGTHSFFVTDTVFVDYNVTRHLSEAMNRRDWDVLTLHYLGLDHIGHIGGVSSPLITPKLREMDSIIMEIYEALLSRDQSDGTRSLFVILGDHGMTDNGNHGGSSPLECETACIFLSPLYNLENNQTIIDSTSFPAKATALSLEPSTHLFDSNGNINSPPANATFATKRRPEIDQVDIAPTISLLLGLPVPQSSTGRLVLDFLPPNLPLSLSLWLESQAALQLAKLLEGNNQLNESLGKSMHQAVTCHVTEPSDHCILLYDEFCQEAGILLNASAGDYSMPRIYSGILVAITLVVLLLLPENGWISSPFYLIFLTISTFFEYFFEWNGLILLVYTCIGLTLALARLLLLTRQKPFIRLFKVNYSLLQFGLVTLSYAAIMFSSTFIEEEHEYWNMLFPTLIIIDAFKHGGRKRGTHQWSTLVRATILTLLFRSLRYWNSTGFINQNEPDVRSFLTIHPWLRDSLYFISVSIVLFLSQCNTRQSPSRLERVLTLLVGIGALAFKLNLFAWSNSILFVRLCLGLVLGGGVLSIRRSSLNNFMFLLTLFLMLVLKSHNAYPLLVILILTRELFWSKVFSSLSTRMALAHVSFFILGPCHIIASVDFSPAYIGQHYYHPIFTSCLVLIVTWAGPILAGAPLYNRPKALLLWRSISQVAVLSSLTLQRHHISIWTVFAPRLLFEYGWTLYYLLLVSFSLLFSK